MNESFVQVPVRYFKVLSYREALVFSYIENLYKSTNKCFISDTKLAEIFNTSVRNIQSILKKLESRKYLIRKSDEQYTRLIIPLPEEERLYKSKVKEETNDFQWSF